MNYPNIKAAKLSQEQIARMFGFKNRAAFRCSSAFHRYMRGVEAILILERNNQMKPVRERAAELINSIVQNSHPKPKEKPVDPWVDMTDERREWLAERGFHQSAGEVIAKKLDEQILKPTHNEN